MTVRGRMGWRHVAGLLALSTVIVKLPIAARRVYALSTAGVAVKDTDRLLVTSFDDAVVAGQDITNDRPG